MVSGCDESGFVLSVGKSVVEVVAVEGGGFLFSVFDSTAADADSGAEEPVLPCSGLRSVDVGASASLFLFLIELALS